MVSHCFGVVQDVIVLDLIRVTKGLAIEKPLDSVGEEDLYALF